MQRKVQIYRVKLMITMIDVLLQRPSDVSCVWLTVAYCLAFRPLIKNNFFWSSDHLIPVEWFLQILLLASHFCSCSNEPFSVPVMFSVQTVSVLIMSVFIQGNFFHHCSMSSCFPVALVVKCISRIGNFHLTYPPEWIGTHNVGKWNSCLFQL